MRGRTQGYLGVLMRKFGRRANLIGQGKPPRSRISFLVCLRVMAGVLARGSYERRDKHALKEYGRKDAAKTDPQQGRVVCRAQFQGLGLGLQGLGASGLVRAPGLGLGRPGGWGPDHLRPVFGEGVGVS